MTTTTLLSPVNEATRLPIDAFRAFAAQYNDLRFLFVDDGSTDNTADMITPFLADQQERFQLLRLTTNAGKAEAVRRGMLLALEDHPDSVGFWDVDLSTPLNQIPLVLCVLAQQPHVLLVMGSRIRMVGREIRRRPKRHCLGRVAATLISLALDLAVYDTQCGAKLFRVTPAVKSVWMKPFASRWLFDVEILFRFLHAFPSGDVREKAKEAICELPLDDWRDVKGSKVRAQHYARALLDLYALWRHYRA